MKFRGLRVDLIISKLFYRLWGFLKDGGLNLDLSFLVPRLEEESLDSYLHHLA